jgi:glutamate racemase
MMQEEQFIALFDSGLGGLSVLRDLRRVLPQHDLQYFADTAFCPYGPRPVAFVQERSLQIARWLIERGARIIVVACNTASSAALELLRAELPVPIVGTEPGLKPAAAATRSGRVGVLATSNTLSGQRFAMLAQRFAHGVEMLTQHCPGLVDAVERGDLASNATRALVESYVEPLLARGVDTLVLGCTHYPFLRPLIAEVAGPDVQIIDTGPAIARQTARVAAQHGISAGAGRLQCWTSGDPKEVAPVLQRLLGEEAPVAHAEV